jgi:hypothetical protein
MPGNVCYIRCCPICITFAKEQDEEERNTENTDTNKGDQEGKKDGLKRSREGLNGEESSPSRSRKKSTQQVSSVI